LVVNPQTFGPLISPHLKKIAQRIALFGASAFKYEIRKIFDCPLKARLWEYKLLNRMNVVQDPKWLNAANGLPFQTRRSGSQGRKLVYIYAENKYRYLDAVTLDIVIKENLGQLKGPPKPIDHGLKVSKHLKGKTKSKEHVEAQVKSFKSNPGNTGFIVYTDGTHNLRVNKGDAAPEGYWLGSCTKGVSLPNLNKGKTYEEIYGEDRAEIIRQSKSEFLKCNNPAIKMQGRSYEEMYGEEEARRLKSIRGLSGKQNTKEYLIYHNDSLVFKGSRVQADEYLHVQFKGCKRNNLYNKEWLTSLSIRVETQRKPH
jgi:hypothetical protein